MDSDLEEGEIKEDAEEARLSLENHRGRAESPPKLGLRKNGATDHGSHTKKRRKDTRVLDERSRRRTSPVNGKMNTRSNKAPTRVSNPPTRVRRLRMDSISKILSKRAKRRVESVQDSSHSSKSIVISVDNFKRSTKDSEAKENKISYGQVSNTFNRASRSLNEKRGNLHLTEVERNEMICSLDNLTRGRSSNSGKNGMSDISDTSDDDRSIVSLDPPSKPVPELIILDDSPDSEGEDVEALQLRKQIIQDLMSKYENTKAAHLKENARDVERNDDEEPYSPVDEDISQKNMHIQSAELISTWLEQAKKSNVEYPALSVSAQSVHSNQPKPSNVVDNIQAQTLVQYPLASTGIVSQTDNTYSTAITSSNVLYSNNLFLPQTPQLGCGDVDMRLLTFQANTALSSARMPLQYSSVMAPDLFNPPQVGPSVALNSFLPQTSNLPSIINDPFGRSFPVSDFTNPAHQQNRLFPYSEPFVEQPNFNYNNSTLQMKPPAHWNQFAANSLPNDNVVNMPGLHSIPPPLPDSAPPAPPPPPPLDTLPPSSHVQRSSSAEIPDSRNPSPPAQIFFPPAITSSLSADPSYPVILQEPLKVTEALLTESQDVDDRAIAYAATFEVLNLKNRIGTSDDETAASSRKSSSKSSSTNSGTKRHKEPVSIRHRSSSPGLKENVRVSRTKHRSADRSGTKSSHRRDSLEHYRKRSRSRSRRRESCKSSKTDVHYIERKKRRDSPPSAVPRTKICRSDSTPSSCRRHSSPEPLSSVSSSTNTVEKLTAHSIQPEKGETLHKIVEKSIDAVGSDIIISVNNEKAITSPPCEPTSTVNIIEPAAVVSEPTSDLQAYSVEDEEILRAQLLLDMARKKNNSIPSPISVSLTVSQSPVIQTINSVLPTVVAEQPKRVAVAKANLPVSSPPLMFVKDNRPTILKSVSNPRSKNRQIVRVANVAPNSLTNFRLQKTITNNTKNPPGPNSLHRIQRTVINTNLLKKNVYNKNADPVMRYLQITVPNKIVTPLIIPASRDDSSSEDEAQDKEANKRSKSSSSVVALNTDPKLQSSDGSKGLPANFEMSLDNLLRKSRQQTSKGSKTPAPSEAVKHLPPSKQEEYMRLKLQLEAYERKIQKKERAKQEHSKGATIAERQRKRPIVTHAQPTPKSILPISSHNVPPNAGDVLAKKVQNSENSEDKPQQSDRSISLLPITEGQEGPSNLERIAEKNAEPFSVIMKEKSAISTTSDAFTVTAMISDDFVASVATTNEKADTQSSIIQEEHEPVSYLSTAVQLEVQESQIEDGNFDEQNLLDDDDDGNGSYMVDFISAENEDKLLQSDDEGNNPEVQPLNFFPTQPVSTLENDNDASMESTSTPENTIHNPESCFDDIFNAESFEASSTETFEAPSPPAHVVDVVKQREELYLREKLLKAALLKKMEASNDRITLRKLEREVVSSRRSINRELTSLLSEMVKMSDLKVVLKSRQDKVISMREQLYAAEQQLNHTVSQLQTRETRRKSLTARVIDMRKRCVDLVKSCRVQGGKIDRNYKVPSNEHLEMKSKLVEVRNQNLVFQRENLKLKMSPRKKSFLEHQGLWKGYRKPAHMSATLAAASRVKKSFNTCLKGKKRVGLSNSIYDPVKSKFKLPSTPQQLKSPVRRPNNYRHGKKMKSFASMGSPLLLTKHGKTTQDPWDGESVFLLPKVLFQDVLTQDETPVVKYKSIPIVPYSVYQSPLESIRKQKKHMSDSNATPGLVKNIDPFVTLCYFELRAMCNSSKCAFQHLYRPQRKVTITK